MKSERITESERSRRASVDATRFLARYSPSRAIKKVEDRIEACQSPRPREYWSMVLVEVQDQLAQVGL